MDPLEYLASLETLGIKFGLDNIRTLCGALDDPQRRFRSVLIAGTNGKGSVTTIVGAALRAAGHRVARYTSPHLVQLEERFWIDGGPVDTPVLRRAAGRVQATIADLMSDGQLEGPPTYFEACTAIAFLLFAEARVELAVLEVGLGGRLDATNCVEPIASAITSIAFDHQRLLGGTLSAIATEKAGIARPNVPVVIGELPTEALEVVERICAARRAPLVRAGSEVGREVSIVDGQTLLSSVRTSSRRYPDTRLGLRGRHQAENAAIAISLLEALEAQGVRLTTEAIVRGLQDASWRGRLELVRRPNGRAVILDAAHNPAGARALASYLDEVYPMGLPIVFGATADKDVEAMLSTLSGSASGLLLTRSTSRRAASLDRLAAAASHAAPGVPSTRCEAFADAMRRAWAMDETICVAGSIFLVGDVLSWLDGDG